MIGIALISFVCGLLGVAVGALFKSAHIDDMVKHFEQQDRSIWQTLSRAADDFQILRARIRDLEQKQKDREDDGK